MDKKVYSVTLDTKIVSKAQKYFSEYGGKLSPLVNFLLNRWVEEHERERTS